MTLMTLDLSLNETGYCVDTGKNGTKSGIIKGNTKLTQYERIENNLSAILRMVEAYKIPLVGIERAAFSRRTSSTNILAEQQGVIKYELKKRNIGVVEVDIGSWKRFITGKGNASKEQVMKSLREQHNVFCVNNNEADAISMFMYLRSLDVVETL